MVTPFAFSLDTEVVSCKFALRALFLQKLKVTPVEMYTKCLSKTAYEYSPSILSHGLCTNISCVLVVCTITMAWCDIIACVLLGLYKCTMGMPPGFLRLFTVLIMGKYKVF